ncbi:MBL fold metallo-hydrolase [Thermomonospora catenispora]|uniref:MBL fold metallo-hydrolase n=1 Tax=Thermomonospora catenispora TaxID=2493090 RepID=UPI001123FC0A|nr:MBL fold metallo-hydrolase [Thermomonospora catenispora]TNY37949.1 MBL fold metallo-hydrolase [Thermomonospora catenispora]
MTTSAPGPGAAQEPVLHELGEGIFGWVQPDGTWWVNNAGAVSVPEGTLIVDTCATEARTRRFLEAVRAATGDVPLRYAVNTHLHGDHTHGNSLLPASTVLIGHEETRKGILEDFIIDGCPPLWEPLPDWGAVTRRPPEVTLTSELAVTLGGRRIELRHPGYTAHTPGDVAVWLPEERVLFTGDLLFNGLTPLLGMGSVTGALRALDWIDSFEPAQVVPGHGPICDAAALPEVLDAHERYYRFVLAVATEGMEAGLSPLEAARRADLGEFASWADAERLVFNVHRAYADTTGEPFDLAQAALDAVTFNGGPMSTSV